MLTNRRTFIGALLWLIPLVASGQDAPSTPLKVLFVGNSYTSVNDLPAMVAALAEAADGRKIEVDRHLVGGCTLEKHVKDQKAIDKIRGTKWDVVVLQEQSLRPVIDRKSMHEYAQVLDAEIKQQGAKTVFYLTWARQHIPDMQEGADPAESPEFAEAMYQVSGAAKTTDFETWFFDDGQQKDTVGLLVLGTFMTTTADANAPKPVRLIFDTDMMGDVDDVGTAAVLHALADQGEVKILAMGLSGKNPSSPLCLDALNTYFRRPEIPIGVVKGPAFDKRSRYAETIAKEFPHKLTSADDAPDAAVLYRKILAGQADNSVVMVSVGQVTNFRNLLKTRPDEHTDLDGVELVKRKVKVWVCMGGKIPEGQEANLIHDGPAAAYAIEHWPTPIVFSGWEIGQEIMTGAGLREAPEGTPVRRAYELFNGLNDRQSWDQTAVLYAVRGLDGGLAHYWDLKTEGHLHVNQDGSNVWRTSPNRPHAYLARKMDPKKIAEAIEDLMLQPPQTKR